MEVGRTIGILVFVLFFLMFYLGLLAFSVVSYILGSKGLYAIAVRRGIKNPWMAWVPVVSNWTLGSLSDQYAQRKYGEDPNLRKKLLIFSIITQSGAFSVPAVGSFNLNLNFGSSNSGMSLPDIPEALQILLIVIGVLALMLCIAMLVLSIIQTVYQYKAYYNLYASCRPAQAMLFLMLAIFTPANPFLIYACRNSDEGLPPEETPAPESWQ